jgi:hypothetical protein
VKYHVILVKYHVIFVEYHVIFGLQAELQPLTVIRLRTL